MLKDYLVRKGLNEGEIDLNQDEFEYTKAEKVTDWGIIGDTLRGKREEEFGEIMTVKKSNDTTYVVTKDKSIYVLSDIFTIDVIKQIRESREQSHNELKEYLVRKGPYEGQIDLNQENFEYIIPEE